jgi:hypothetical protein
VPGLDPSTTYTVRCHFAEYTETQPGRRMIDINVQGAQTVSDYDLISQAGAPFKAMVVDVPGGKPGADGNLNILFFRHGGGDGHVVVCGFEILKPDGTRAFALNCGGPAVGGFQGETYDMPDRSFAFQRPGPMVVDSRGDLWIIQEANDSPIGTTVTTKYPGAILCYHPNGTFTGKQITDVANPSAIAYDSVRDRLLIADNGPNQNIRIYSTLASAPSLSSTFGNQGGIFSGASPGAIYDPAAGGYARFDGLTAVGVDAAGNIYVSSGMQGTDLREFTPSGHMVWQVAGLPFCTTPGLDPDSDGTEAYGVYYHAHLNYASHAPGSEWSYQGYNWNPFKYGIPPREGNAQAIIRRMGPHRSLFMFTSGQGSVDYCGIFRFDGNTIIPCGSIDASGSKIWIDANGDGIQTKDEVETGNSAGGLCRFSVDLHGDIWMTLMGATPIARHFKFMGLNAFGVPIYDLKPGDYDDIPFPGIGKPISTWAQIAVANYDTTDDSMYMLGPAANRIDGYHSVLSYLARYDHWSQGNRKARWLIYLPDPGTDTNFPYDNPDPHGLGYQWMGMDVATDRVFIDGLTGNIDMFNALNGSLDRIISPGPEIDGFMAWEDASMGLTAIKRKDGEYVVFAENSGFDGKDNMYRIPAGE